MNRYGKNPKTRSILLLTALLLASSGLVYRDFLFGNSFLAFTDVGSDTWQQYVMHYHTIVNHLKEGTFSLWDFNNGFGINVFQLYLFDPSFMLLYAIGVLFGTEAMLNALVYVQILRILAAGLAGYFFLSEFSLSEKAKVFAAYLYGFNGFLLVWGQHYQFGIMTVYLPLILMAAERAMKRGRMGKGLPFTVFLAVIDSTYFSYMCCLTAGIFLVFRALLLKDVDIRERLKRFFHACLGILLGVGMGLAVMLPSVHVLFRVTARLGSDYSLLERLLMGLKPVDGVYYQTLLFRLFSANLLNKMESYQALSGLNYYEDPSLFSSIFFVIFGIQYLLILWKQKISRFHKGVLYGAAVLTGFALLLPMAGIIYNGFTAQIDGKTLTVIPFSRFTFVLMPFFALLMAGMADYVLKGGRLNRLGLLLTLLVGTGVFAAGYKITLDPAQKELIFWMAFVSALSVLLVGSFSIKRTEKVQKTVLLGVLLLAVSDVCLEGAGTLTGRETVKKDGPEVQELYNPDVRAALDYLEETDREFYRVEKTYTEPTICLSSLAQNYAGVSTYNSMQNGNIIDFVTNCAPELPFLDMNHYWFSHHIAEDGKIANFFGIRYLLSKNGAPKNYELLKTFGDIKVYKAKRDVTIGRFYRPDQIVSNDEFREKANNQGSQEAIDTVLNKFAGMDVPKEELEEKRAAEQHVKGKAIMSFERVKNDSHIKGKVEAPEDGYLLLTIPYEKGWHLTIDGEKQEILKADLGFLGVPVSQGSHVVELHFRAPLLLEGLCLSSVFWAFYLVYCLFYRRKGVERA